MLYIIKKSEIFLGLISVYLFIAWMLSYFVDVRGWTGIHEAMIASGNSHPLVWWMLFREGSPTEVMQWTMLFLGVVSCGSIATRIAKGDKRARIFFVVLGVGMTLMLMEDVGNIRHVLARQVAQLAGHGPNPHYNHYRTVTETAFYGLIAALMLYPILFHSKVLEKSKRAMVYLSIGYALYGIASISSATRYLWGWYESVGNAIVDFLGVIAMQNWTIVNQSLVENARPSVGFYIMDFVMEESLELLAAGFLLAGLVAYSSGIKDKLQAHR